MSRAVGPVTRLLHAAERGDSDARSRLWETVYDELHAIAERQLAAGDGKRMQPTSLISEAYVRLIGDLPVSWANRRHFFAAAAESMRRIRVDDARKRNAAKRGGDRPVDALNGDPPIFDGEPAELLAVDEALEQLQWTHPRQAQVVTLRYFGGLSIDETAGAMGLSPRTVDTEWRFAKAWLHRVLGGSAPNADREGGGC